jgi:hypothetical protein
MKPVSLKKVADELEMIGEGIAIYISTQTGHMVVVTEDLEMMLDEEDPPEWAQDIIPEVRQVLNSDEFIPLPDAHEIHEYEIMENFCNEVQDEAFRNELLDLIRGSGAFRRFKNFINNKGIDKDWYAHRGSALKNVAKEFLEEQNIPFIDDEAPLPLK